MGGRNAGPPDEDIGGAAAGAFAAFPTIGVLLSFVTAFLSFAPF